MSAAGEEYSCYVGGLSWSTTERGLEDAFRPHGKLIDAKMVQQTAGDGCKSRVALILIDGLGDVSIPGLGGLTAVEAAATPNMDALARAGVNGLLDPVEPGLACGSDTAHLSLLGYNPRVYYRGRGAFESLGAGLAMSPGDIAFKSNFATLDEATGIVISRRADRRFEQEGPIFCAALDRLKLPSFPNYEVRVRYATEHRCGVVVKGAGLSGSISGTDPLKDNRPLLTVVPLDNSDEAKHTAAVVNELSHERCRILTAHPLNVQRIADGKNIANVVLLRGCGIRIEVPTFFEKHGLRPCMVAPTKIIAGLGLSLDIDILEAPGATGDYRTLLTSKAVAIAKALAAPMEAPPNVFLPGESDSKPGWPDGYDFGFLHIKAIDDAGHDKAVMLKVKAFEAVDKMIGQLAHLLWQAESTGNASYSICVTGDHSTPVEFGDHSFEPVPFTICRLKDFVQAIGGQSIISATSMDPFRLPCVSDELCQIPKHDGGKGDIKTIGGDSVSLFSELSAARGCLGRFQGSEMMGVIKKFLHQG